MQPSVSITELEDFDAQALFPLAQQWHEGMTLERFGALLAQMQKLGYRLFVAKLGEQIVGMTGLWQGCKFYCGRYLEIDNFVVDATHRGMGIGGKLVDFVTDLARREGFDTVTLNVYIDNHGANQLYDRHGFTKIGYHRFLLVNPEANASPLHARLSALRLAETAA